MLEKIRAGIFGATGYTAVALLEVLIRHPNVEIEFATTRQENLLGKNIYQEHPNLSGLTDLKFSLYEPKNPDLLYSQNVLKKAKQCDVVFLCTPPEASFQIVKEMYKDTRIIDASSAFRLRDPKKYKEVYENDHPMPEFLKEFVYGLPELHREEIRHSKYVACPGCNAAAMILAAYPLTKLDKEFGIQYVVNVGSSEAGAHLTRYSHHPERSGVVRPYSVKGHRHLAEVEQELGISKIGGSMYSVDMVRGIHCTGFVFSDKKIEEKDLWRVFREVYKNESRKEPFIRIRVKKYGGPGSLPDVKYVRGSNFCDVGFFVDEGTNRTAVMSALDNLVKGDIAGNGVQAMNLMFGLDETARLIDMVPSYLYE